MLLKVLIEEVVLYKINDLGKVCRFWGFGEMGVMKMWRTVSVGTWWD